RSRGGVIQHLDDVSATREVRGNESFGLFSQRFSAESSKTVVYTSSRLPLTPGSTRLGIYEVTALIGEGGMGLVYRARDTKLNRDVALKVLPDSFASDPDRLARFTREARTLASLNHPNIAHIHGFEESGGVHALVMELVEGDDLSQRIARLRAAGATAGQARHALQGVRAQRP